MILTGFITDTFAASRLLKFSTDSLPFVDINYCCRIFTHIENPNGFIFNTMMRAYIQRNSPEKAMCLYKLMLNNNVGVDNYTYPLLVQASALRLSVFEGKMVHGHVFKVGFDFDVYVNNTLINMYAVCGTLSDARKLFDESPSLDSVSWNSILAGYVNAGNVEEARTGNNEMYEDALVTFRRMNDHGVMVDEVVVVSVLTACARLTDVMIGKLIHSLVVKIGVEYYVNLQNALIHMYSSCEEIVSAEKLFCEMQLEGIMPDQTILVSIISACTRLASLDQGKWIHTYIRKNGLKINAILGTTLIDMYMKLGCVENALDVFHGMEEIGVSTWNALILGYAMNGPLIREEKAGSANDFVVLFERGDAASVASMRLYHVCEGNTRVGSMGKSWALGAIIRTVSRHTRRLQQRGCSCYFRECQEH
ncbi:hypothetical protein Q3G72_018182 [Acer saccharum]|nr:hypothetical protein Q3G72_018182 [Acer saccharum]